MASVSYCTFQLLGYVGQTSPECLLIPGVPLNIEGPIPEDLNEGAESMMQRLVLEQKHAELDYFNKHKSDARYGSVLISLYCSEINFYAAQNSHWFIKQFSD